MAKNVLTIKNWYETTYPEDGLGAELDGKATFLDLQKALESGKDVYAVIGVGDSCIRERCFDKLASIWGVGYDAVYDMWLYGARARRAAWTARILAI